MLSTLILASATMLQADHQAFLKTLESANAANQESVTVCVQPPASLYADLSDDEAFETPLGKVEKIAEDINLIKNAVDAGNKIKDASVDVAVKETPTTWKEWVYFATGVILAFFLKLAFNICSRFKSVCVRMNQILKQAEENEKKTE